jgi:hypothetical protein
MIWIQGHSSFSRRAQTNLRTDLGKRIQRYIQFTFLLSFFPPVTEKGYTKANPQTGTLYSNNVLVNLCVVRFIKTSHCIKIYKGWSK